MLKTYLLVSILFFNFFFSVAQTNTSNIPLERKIAQMLMVGFRDTAVNAQSDVIQWIETLGIGGVILYEYDGPSKSRPRNITSPRQLKQLTSSLQAKSKIPLFIGIDEEGGTVSRLKTRYGFLPSVSAKYLGSLNNEDSTRFYAARIAGQCQQMGINLNFAPDVDVDINPLCPVIGKLERSFSSDPNIVAHQAGWEIDEHQKQQVWCSLKHFPGHGSAQSDSHLGFTDVSTSWQPIELLPYKLLIKQNQCPMVMTAHVFNNQIDSIYPATLSKKTLALLRDSLQYNGLILSDDMMMGAIAKQFGLEDAIYRAIDAGVDVLLFSNNIDRYDTEIANKVIQIVLKLVDEGKLSSERIDVSYQKIMQYKSQLNTQ